MCKTEEENKKVYCLKYKKEIDGSNCYSCKYFKKLDDHTDECSYFEVTNELLKQTRPPRVRWKIKNLQECTQIFEDNKNIFFKEDNSLISVTKNAVRLINDTKTFNKVYMHYKAIGGKDDLETFIKDMKAFIEITFTYFILRDTRKNPLKEEFTDNELWKDQNECIKCWIGYKGSHIEADRYYSAINYITGYY